MWLCQILFDFTAAAGWQGCSVRNTAGNTPTQPPFCGSVKAVFFVLVLGWSVDVEKDPTHLLRLHRRNFNTGIYM